MVTKPRREQSGDGNGGSTRRGRIIGSDARKSESGGQHRLLGFDGLEVEPEVAQPELVLSRSEEHTSELQSHLNLVCRLLLEKKKTKKHTQHQFMSRDQ